MTDRPPRVWVWEAVEVSDGDVTRRATVTNVSEGGVFLAINPPIPLDRGVALWLTLGDMRWPLRGHVRWTRTLPAGPDCPVGSGVALYDPDGQLAAELREAIERLRRA